MTKNVKRESEGLSSVLFHNSSSLVVDIATRTLKRKVLPLLFVIYSCTVSTLLLPQRVHPEYFRFNKLSSQVPLCLEERVEIPLWVFWGLFSSLYQRDGATVGINTENSKTTRLCIYRFLNEKVKHVNVQPLQ